MRQAVVDDASVIVVPVKTNKTNRRLPSDRSHRRAVAICHPRRIDARIRTCANNVERTVCAHERTDTQPVRAHEGTLCACVEEQAGWRDP